MTDDVELPEDEAPQGRTVDPFGLPEAPDDGADELDDEDDEVEGEE